MRNFEKEVDYVYGYLSDVIIKSLLANPDKTPMMISEAIRSMRLNVAYGSMEGAVRRLSELDSVMHRTTSTEVKGVAIDESLHIWAVEVKEVLEKLKRGE